MKFQVENLCGYTANMKPMQAGKIKKALNGKRVKFIFVGLLVRLFPKLETRLNG